MICKQCGAEIEDGSALCPRCGKPPEEAPESQTAPVEETSVEDILSQASEWISDPPEEAAPAGPAEPLPDAAERPAPPKRKEPVWLFAVLGIVVVAAVAALIFWLFQGGKKDPGADPDLPASSAPAEEQTPGADTPPDSPSDPSSAGEKSDTYTVPNDEITAEMASRVAATCGVRQLSNTELSYYYWNQFYSWANAYGDYLSYFLDVNTPLSEQSYPDDPERSWESFLLDAALETFHQTIAIVEAAEQAGFAIDSENADYLALLPDTLAGNAERLGMDSADEFLQGLYGPYADVDSYTQFVRDSLVSYGYLNQLFAAIEYSPEDIGAWFDENQARFEDMGLRKDEPNMVNVRHILIKPSPTGEKEDGESGDAELTDQDWAAAKQRASDLLAQWQSGEATEDTFALLASENTEDPGSQGTGGLYEGVYPGEMVAAFNDWCFEENRQPGDTGIVETEYGYHIMYFSATLDHAHWYETAEQDYLASRQQDILDSLTADRPMQANYDSIILMESNAMQ